MRISWVVKRSPRRRLQKASCKDCGTPLTKRRGMYCGGCRHARERQHIHAARAARAATMKADDAEQFTPEEIFERDNWTCWICHLPVRRHGSHLHPMSPQVDHVIPIAQGGRHTKENTRCACRRCNLRKGSAHSNSRAEKA